MVESRGPQGIALISALLVICWTFASLRLYVRLFLSKSFGADDALLITSMISFTTYSAFALTAIKYGVGRHPSDVVLADLPNALYFWWLATLFYTTTLYFVRLCIAVFLYQLAARRAHRVIIWATMAIVTIYSLFYFFLTIFQCTPPQYFWRRFGGMKGGKCLQDDIFPGATYGHSTVSAVADWVLAGLPIWLIWDLQMNFRTKVSVGVLLGMGMVAGVAAIIRIPYIRILSTGDEFLWNVVDVSLWSFVEAGLGIIAASASALRPLFKRFYQLSGYASRRNPNSTNPNYPGRGEYIRNKSGTGARDMFSSGTRRDESIELELGATGRTRTGAVGGNGSGSAKDSRSGSEENLTGTGKEIYVQTVVEVRR